jgi:serine O-acetyltransferase
MKRIRNAFSQLGYLWYEASLLVNIHWWRWFTLWFRPGFVAVAAYRVNRFAYLLLGNGWIALRIVLSPVFFLIRPWVGRCAIPCTATIGKGLKLVHPGLGVAINGTAVCGDHLTLTGGNCIGNKGVRLGNHVTLGANASVIGPLELGNNIRIGAGAVVVKSYSSDLVLVGVPAKPTRAKQDDHAAPLSQPADPLDSEYD